MPIPPNLLTTSDIASILQLKPDTVRKYVQSGRLIPTKSIGTAHLFSRQEFERFRKLRRPVGNPAFHRKK